ncbi:hypothetical protein HZF24_15750 [Sedimentibacter hydroxybenzoicus DSM 7310]|uniref:Uncharacterized protein n=1 Tax=Sedimentibacter hydroxybenzoicus DSM 7310 TaxID=1123245 RepID=A0A974BMT6_SEDHY|nr:hypothetical protein [Sedimentibacter hydroxybenzoicus]NYB75602.1 hypothetical protein [Sedimentibacter hydroxybenzoicus DSM 7310]
MEKKDKLGTELKKIMEEETFDMTLSQAATDNILKNKKKKLSQRMNEFLNREIEIPLAPAIIGLAALFAITVIPKNIFDLQERQIINIEGSQIIVRERYEVVKNEDKN